MIICNSGGDGSQYKPIRLNLDEFQIYFQLIEILSILNGFCFGFEKIGE